MKSIYLFFAALFTSMTVYGQSAVTGYDVITPEFEVINPQPFVGYGVSTYASGTNYTLYFGGNSTGLKYQDRIIAGFNVGPDAYQRPIDVTGSLTKPFDRVNLVRIDNGAFSGEFYSALASTVGISGSQTYLNARYVETMEDLINQYSLHYGTDNIFSNVGTGNLGVSTSGASTDTGNNIERVDMIFDHGIGAKTEEARAKLGFLVNERGGNDGFYAAAITELDEAGDALSFGERVFVQTWGSVGPSIRSTVFMGSYDNIRPKMDLSNQTVAGVFISLEDLSVPAGTRVFGLSLVSADYPESLSFATPGDPANPKNTLATSGGGQGGLDMMSGSFFSREENEYQVLAQQLTGNVWHDLNLDGVLDSGESRISGKNTEDDGAIAAGSNLFLHVVVNGVVVDNIEVDADGTYTYESMLPNTVYQLVLATSAATTGSASPGPSYPEAFTYYWSNLDGTTIEDSPGVISFTSPGSGIDLNNVNFGLQQRPVAEDKVFTGVPNSNFVDEPLPGFPSVTDYKGIPVSSTVLSEDDNEVRGGLTGADAEDGDSDIATPGRSFRITTIEENTKLYYDFGDDGIRELVPGDVLENFDYEKLVLYGRMEESVFEFTYELRDQTGVWSDPASYRVTTLGALPVVLVNFDVMIEEGVPVLQWKTAVEEGARHFEVERRGRSVAWSKIAAVPAKNEAGGYRFADKAALNGLNYYRLKMLDLDGSFTYSPVRSLEIKTNIAAYPNPVSDKLSLLADVRDIAEVQLVDLAGRTVLEKIAPIQEVISVSSLPGGYYILHVRKHSGEMVTRRVLIKR